MDWKKVAPYLVALVVFLGFAIAYCSPILEGKVVYAGDTMNWLGGAHQTQEYRAQTGETSWWTNSMFSGMPTYQIDAPIPSNKVSIYGIRDVLHLGLGETMGIIFGYFLCFYILLISFGVNPWLSIAGGLAMGMSSYFFIIIPAGHVTKAVALGFLPALVGGIHLIFKEKYLLGIPILLLFGIAGITMHPQMTYYVAMLIGVMVIAEIGIKIHDQEWKNIGISLAICVGSLLLVIGARAGYLKINNEYVKETMRGGHSELTRDTEEAPAAGLSYKYATDWSYGIDETLTLLVPNAMGGASGYNVGEGSTLYKELIHAGVPKNSAKQFCKSAPTYWGDKMFTSGAVYVGAIICFLFVLGLIIVPGAIKWALLFATLMSIFLAWGRHFPFLTHFFFDYFPMYNKFRAVESILIVAEITMPLLGFLGLQRIIEGKVDWDKLRASLFIAGGITGGICLILALFGGSMFSFTSSFDNQWKGQVGNDIYDMIIDQRRAMLSADAWRSLLFVALGFGLTYWYAWQRNKAGNQTKYTVIFLVGLGVCILADMIPVDKRFFNNDNFVKQKEAEAHFKMQPWEQEILQDKSLDYRVLNLSSNTFNDSRTSYRLNSIGGYHAAKLRRYQDLIDEHISKNNFRVINMLNAKYIIHPQYGVIQNPDAMGNAWFVNNVQFVPTPDDESAALNTLDLHTTAVADEKFRDVLTCETLPNETDEIILTDYAPNRLTYSSHNAQDRVAVFSEIYYPYGWRLYIDGKEHAIGRVNYVLRAAVIPAGEHTIVMEFYPESLKWDKLGFALVILAILLSIGCLGLSLRYYFSSRKNEAKV